MPNAVKSTRELEASILETEQRLIKIVQSLTDTIQFLIEKQIDHEVRIGLLEEAVHLRGMIKGMN